METTEVRVAAIMTAPRYECTYARNQIEKTLKELSIPLTVSGGVFYGQCMQRMLEQLVGFGNVDYAVTIDFDSLFTRQQLERLVSWIVSRDDIDAIAPMQARRSRPVMLGTVHGSVDATTLENGDKQVLVNNQPLRARTAHFGLTVIDLKKLASVPKPWFACQPDSNGGWEDDKIDDDIWFWMQWEKAGHSIYLATDVRIGHLEEMVAIHGPDMQVRHIYPSEWEAQRDSADSSLE
jgi:hypothetical protein